MTDAVCTGENLRCLRCNNRWTARFARRPKVCAGCNSPYWNVPRVLARVPAFSNDELIYRALTTRGRVRVRIAFSVQDPTMDPITKRSHTRRLLTGTGRLVEFKSRESLRRFLRLIDTLLECVSLAGETSPVEQCLVLLREELLKSAPSSGRSTP